MERRPALGSLGLPVRVLDPSTGKRVGEGRGRGGEIKEKYIIIIHNKNLTNKKLDILVVLEQLLNILSSDQERVLQVKVQSSKVTNINVTSCRHSQ